MTTHADDLAELAEDVRTISRWPSLTYADGVTLQRVANLLDGIAVIARWGSADDGDGGAA